jgi:hypothetical protein
MTDIKKTLIKIAIGIILAVAGWNIASLGDDYISEETLKESETFCKNASTTTIGFLDSTYTETTVTVMKLKTKMYTFGYHFKANEASFQGTYTSNILKNNGFVKVWYDKNNPASNTSSDPCISYEYNKTKKFSAYKDYYYVVGLVMLLIGIGLLYSSVVNLVRGLFFPKQSS